MNDDFSDFEIELRKLQPAGISKPLEQRMAALLDAPASSVCRASWWQRLGFTQPSAAFGWGLFSPALTAMIVVAITQFAGFQRHIAPSANHPVAQEDQLTEHKPALSAGHLARTPVSDMVHAATVLDQMQDEGIVLNGELEPVRRVRYRSTDLVQWRNPDTGVHWEVSYPREDVALVPIHAD